MAKLNWQIKLAKNVCRNVCPNHLKRTSACKVFEIICFQTLHPAYVKLYWNFNFLAEPDPRHFGIVALGGLGARWDRKVV
jgi:hypothetical protein